MCTRQNARIFSLPAAAHQTLLFVQHSALASIVVIHTKTTANQKMPVLPLPAVFIFPQLELVSGFGQAALQHFAAPLLQVLTRFCSSSRHLKHGSEGQWVNVARIRSGPPQQQQQTGQSQFAGFCLTQGAAATGQDPTQAPAVAAAAATQAGHLHVDSELYQALLDAKVLSEPKAAAAAAWERWQAGESAEQVATAREKPIQVRNQVQQLVAADR